MEEAYKNYVVFYEDTIYTTVTADPNIVSDWISAIMHFHRYKLYNLVVVLDVEWRPSCNSVQNPAVATIQICIGNRCLIYQIIYSTNRFPQSLIDFLSNDDFTFVGVDVQSDFNALKTDYEMTCNPRAVVLRMLAASALGRADLNQTGLKTLAGLVLGKEMDTSKRVRTSNWDTRWLTDEQVNYGCIDAFVSFKIGNVLKAYYWSY
ncbi:hypothetical protein CASFOL_000770 [Castilleja foliolosa]|uniref:3'-5' exonuclease domain-containing protein n=1 Tax=Castilleja foliolosa TaxID=1961234 RepID=A0ABD3EP29_9LAMI